MPPRKTEVALLELTPTQFQDISDNKARDLLRTQEALNYQRAWYAALGLILGTLTYIVSIGACIYLAMHGFPKLAAACLGTPILTTIKRMIESRL